MTNRQAVQCTYWEEPFRFEVPLPEKWVPAPKLPVIQLTRHRKPCHFVELLVSKLIVPNMKTLGPKILIIFVLATTPMLGQKDSKRVQPKPIETTVCKITENPSVFNNKLVKVRGHVEVNFEYAILEDDSCSDELWFAFADGSGPPGLVMTVNGWGKPGGKNSKGTLVKPVPVKLVRDSNFNKFEHYMSVKAEAKPCVNDPFQPTPVDCAVDRVTATFTGRIDSVSKEIHAAHAKRSSFERNDGKGFGQMGMFDAQLVLQSVEDVAAIDSFGRSKP